MHSTPSFPRRHNRAIDASPKRLLANRTHCHQSARASDLAGGKHKLLDNAYGPNIPVTSYATISYSWISPLSRFASAYMLRVGSPHLQIGTPRRRWPRTSCPIPDRERGRDTGDPGPSVAELDQEQDVEALEQEGVNGEEIGGDEWAAWARRKPACRDAGLESFQIKDASNGQCDSNGGPPRST